MSNEMIWDDFSEHLPHRDLGLKVKDRIFWIPRSTLAEISPVFQTMFYGPYAESKKEIIELPDKEAEEILELLRCLFRTKGKLKQIDSENVEILMKLADEYQIEYLIEECKDFVIKKAAVVDNKSDDIVKLFGIGVRYGMKKLVRDLFPDIFRYHITFYDGGASDLGVIWSRKSFFDQLPLDVRNAILVQSARPETPERCHEFRGPVNHDVECKVCVRRKLKNWKACRQCVFCGVGTCEKRIHYWDEWCYGCRVCKNTNPRNGHREKNCQCINPLAIEDLEKVGL